MLEHLEIITCSYGPDRARCARLCESVDRFVALPARHTLVVPARDVPLFKSFERPHRRVLAVEDVLPARFIQLPRQDRWWIDRFGWPVRGWIMQQVTKLSATEFTDREYLLFADSDLRFIRTFRPEDILQEGRLRLHRVPGAMSEGVHLAWHQRAGQLLGLPRQYHGSDYVGQLITWRRSNLAALQQHIEDTTGKPWVRAVSRSLRFSEYILYGSFVEHVLDSSEARHFYTDQDLCHCCWFREDAEALCSGEDHPADSAVALLVQSNLELSPTAEQAIHDAALQHAKCLA